MESMDEVGDVVVPEVENALDAMDTPALVVVDSVFERNMQRMNEIMKRFPNVTLRPHLKAHKSAYFAQAQARAGVTAWCCQKLHEAETILPKVEGMRDLLITNEIVGKRKIERLVNLLQQYHSTTKITVLVDDISNCLTLNTAIGAAGLPPLRVLAEVDVGQDRCGVQPGSEELMALALVVNACDHLEWGGLQCYQGKLQHVRNYDEKRELVNEVAAKARASRDVLAQKGIPCPIISGGGTGTFVLEGEAGVHTECQPGSYVFMDADYGRNFDQEGKPFHDFDHSLFVHTTVMSKPNPLRLVVDAGMKAVSLDSGAPIVVLLHDDGTFTSYEDECTYVCGGDEHGIIAVKEGSQLADFKVGHTLQLIPGHCDPTVNLYDQYFVVEHDSIVALPPIEGRGPGL